jgi:CHAT domain-containing protein/Tfp pilus assembly protein PilF
MRLGHRAMRFVAFLSVALSLAWTQTAHGQPATILRPGVVIEKVDKYSEAEKTGFAEGDIILRWSRGDAKGEILSPFDLVSIEIEQAPRGTVRLEGLRGSESRVWAMGQDTWGIQLRPRIPEALATMYRDGQEAAAAGKLSTAAERWRALALQAESSRLLELRSWLFFHIANLEAEARNWKEADEAYQAAVSSPNDAGADVAAHVLRAWGNAYEERSDWSRAEQCYRRATAAEQQASAPALMRAIDLDNLGNLAYKRGDFSKAVDYYGQALAIREQLAPDRLVVARSLTSLGRLADEMSDLGKAEDYHQRALLIAEKIAPESLIIALIYTNLGNVALDRGVLAKAEELYRRGLEIRQKLGPDSLDVSGSLNDIGLVYWTRGDLPKAEAYLHQSLEIRERLAPASPEIAGSLGNLGNVAFDRGDLAKAEAYYQRALELWEKLAPGSLFVAMGFANLGDAAHGRSDLAKAEEYHRKALEIRKRLAPGSLDLAGSFDGLAGVSRERGDLARAEEYYLQSQTIYEKLSPGSLYVAGNLDNLTQVAFDRGDLVKAEEFARRAVAIAQKAAPESLEVASTFTYLGQVVAKRGDLAQAESYYQKALIIQEKLAPGGPDIAWNLNSLGEVVRKRGDLERAEQYYQRAFALWEKLAPASTNEAESLAGLASIMRQRGQMNAATPLYERALRALEGQTEQLGGTADVRAGFRAKYESYYQDYVGMLMAQGKPDLAFQALERSRAQTLLEMLASAHLDIHRGAEPALLREERSLQEGIAARVDRRMRRLGDKAGEERVAEIDKEISGLRDQYQGVEARIRASSPGYAALTQPQPLSVVQTQRLLDQDTVLLEYSLGDERSYLFAVTPDAVTGYELPKRAEIELLARDVYALLTAHNRVIKSETPQQRQTRMAKADRTYMALGRQLSNMLLPAGSALQGKRLLIVADGALHYIPFAALPDPQDLSIPPVPLMIAHEVVNLPSASVLAVLRRQEQERNPAPKAVAVLADPVFSVHDGRLGAAVSLQRNQSRSRSKSETDPDWDRRLTRSVRDVGLELSRLPYTRREAEAIFALAPPHRGMKALDFGATRAAAIDPELSQYRIIHFATHGLLDSQHPELSGLVLSLVDKQGKPQSGFLSLEDIYNLDLPAELVVLSACETGLGKEINGEGLIGLTRGFMYAGAHRVVASLWSVNDAATAELMAAFYQGVLRDKIPPAAALRRAQAQMWKRARWKSPYYWAAFQIQGDWK